MAIAKTSERAPRTRVRIRSVKFAVRAKDWTDLEWPIAVPDSQNVVLTAPTSNAARQNAASGEPGEEGNENFGQGTRSLQIAPKSTLTPPSPKGDLPPQMAMVDVHLDHLQPDRPVRAALSSQLQRVIVVSAARWSSLRLFSGRPDFAHRL